MEQEHELFQANCNTNELVCKQVWGEIEKKTIQKSKKKKKKLARHN